MALVSVLFHVSPHMRRLVEQHTFSATMTQPRIQAGLGMLLLFLVQVRLTAWVLLLPPLGGLFHNNH